MKRILCLILTLLMLCPLFASCALFGDKQLTVIEEGTSEYLIIYPAKDTEAQEAANVLSQILRELTDVVVETASDSTEEDECEILVGNTNRTASEEAAKALEGKKDTFAVAAFEKQLTLVATDGLLKTAAELFYAGIGHLLGGSVGDGLLTLPTTLSYTHTLKAEKDSASLLAASLQPSISVTSTLTIPAKGSFTRIGGITCDGENLYAALHDGSNSVICKLPLAGGNALYSDTLTGKALSLTFDPLAQTVVALHGDTVTALTAADLTVTGSGDATGYAALMYVTEKNRYVLKYSGNGNVALLNGALQSSRGSYTLPKVTEDLTVADMAKDSRFVYLLTDEGKLTVADTTSTRFLHIALPDNGKATALAIYGKDLFLAMDNAVLQCKFEPDAVNTNAQPSDLFTDAFMADVDDSGWEGTKVAEIYKLNAAAFGNHYVMQGGTSDGQYGYFCFEDQKGDYYAFEKHTTIIAKVNLITWELVAYSEPLYLDHCNDMCYNSNTGELMVVHNGSKAKRISFIDRETLTVTGHHDLAINIYSMSYNPLTDQYVVGKSGGRNYAILDGNFNVVVSHLEACPSSAFTTAPKVTTQGIHCDSRYIYAVVCTHDGSKWTCYLTVHDWQGNFIFAKVLPDMPEECEHIFNIGNVFYIGFSTKNTTPVYRYDITG